VNLNGVVLFEGTIGTSAIIEIRQIDELKEKVSKRICSILRERISLLKQFGLTGLWFNTDSEGEFNAVTVLEHSIDDWMLILMYSSLWRVDGQLKSVVMGE
jgi:hypothetical protein